MVRVMAASAAAAAAAAAASVAASASLSTVSSQVTIGRAPILFVAPWTRLSATGGPLRASSSSRRWVVPPIAFAIGPRNRRRLAPAVAATAPDSDPDHGTSDIAGRASENRGGDRNLRLVGVCGGIGSGKSLASRILRDDLGAVAHVDADGLGHEAYAPGSDCVLEIGKAFGEGVLLKPGNGRGAEVDRKALGSIVFADPEAMSRLERIVWPHVESLLLSRIKNIEDNLPNTTARTDPPLAVVEAAVLLDAGWSPLFDAVWAVRSPRLVRRDRLIEDRDMEGEEADARIEAQSTRKGIEDLEGEMESGTVTCVIENTGTVEGLRAQLREALVDPHSWRDGKPVLVL
uniref:Dephospho-CoA kinase n=1 Tax=Trieres chinensis TaxID=1514140 RepID=A0A7S1YTR9_TRICV|mmetsp:Transcript_10600/g.22211  ORF Transcript_10600/g.22211 Transcript_10600/m.22211 type:complete len:346 (+) Transcript_10600:27-1064(+)